MTTAELRPRRAHVQRRQAHIRSDTPLRYPRQVAAALARRLGGLRAALPLSKWRARAYFGCAN